MEKNSKLQARDLINVGIFTAIYFVLFFASMMLGYAAWLHHGILSDRIDDRTLMAQEGTYRDFVTKRASGIGWNRRRAAHQITVQTD